MFVLIQMLNFLNSTIINSVSNVYFQNAFAFSKPNNKKLGQLLVFCVNLSFSNKTEYSTFLSELTYNERTLLTYKLNCISKIKRYNIYIKTPMKDIPLTMKDQNITPSTTKQKRKSRCKNTTKKSVPTVTSSEITHFCCNSCDEYFTQKQLLLRHLKLHKATAYQRKTCKEEEQCERDSDNVLLQQSQVREKKYSCKHCGKDCKCESTLVKHLVPISNIETSPFACQVCEKPLKYKCLLLQHMEQHEEKGKEKKNLVCRICGKLYTKIGSLVNHERQHEGKGSFKCRPCGAMFTTEEDRTRHKNANHKKPWKCSICHHSFTVESKLEAHIQWHESKVTEVFLCNLCGKEFKLKVNLKVHVESQCGTEPQHMCKVCGKAFMTRGTLVTHSLLHTGEKAFLCRFCGKSFRLKVEMQRHERSHTGEKPFVCKVCNKAFAYRESLVTHNTLHTGKRPYMCECCASMFSCIGNLIKHQTIYDGKCGESNCNTRDKSKRSTKLRKTVNSLYVPPSVVEPVPSVDIHSSVVGTLVPIKPVETALVVTSTIIPIVAAPVISINGHAANELPSFVQANCYSYRNPCYENNAEWVTPFFTAHESTIPMSVDLNSGNMDRRLKSSHYYWGSNNGLVMQPDLGQQTFPSYGTVIRDPLKPESSFQDLTLYNPPQGLTEMNNVFEPSETENYKLEHNSQNFNTVLNGTGYEATNCTTSDSNIPEKVLLPVNPAACDGDKASELLISNIVNDSAQVDMIETPTNIIHPANESDTGVKAEEPCDTSSPTNNSFSDCESLEPESEPRIDNLAGEIKFAPIEVASDTLHDRKEKCENGNSEAGSSKPDINSEEDYFACTSNLISQNGIDSKAAEISCVTNENSINKAIDASSFDSDSDEEESEKHLERHTHKNDKLNDSKKNKFHCQDCNKGFDFLSRLTRHRKCHAVDFKEALACQFCDRKYTNKTCLAKHELQHAEDFFYTCKECSQKFNNKVEYRSHRARLHRKQWNCTICERSFSTASNLKNHINNKHHGNETVPSYVCHICGKLFKQKGNLKVHVDSQCGTDPQFVCNVCGKAFMSYGSLGTHLLLHTGEKTFLCRFCGKSFRLKVEMQRHERTHTGEKPFVCKVCNKAFAHRESLVTHNTTHTGIRPYMCEVCGSTFSCIGNLIKHRQTRNRRCGIATTGIDTQQATELSAI